MMARYNDLPNEVVLEIFSHLHLSSLVDFALLCKRHYALSPKFLKQLKDIREIYHEIADRFSLTFPRDLKKVFLDPRFA